MELHQFFLYLAVILIAARLFSEVAGRHDIADGMHLRLFRAGCSTLLGACPQRRGACRRRARHGLDVEFGDEGGERLIGQRLSHEPQL